MFFARGRIGVGQTSVELSLGVCDDGLVVAMRRRNAVFDSRHVPRSSSLPPRGNVVYLLLEGELVWLATGERFAAPCVFVSSDDFAPSNYRTEGRLMRAVEVYAKEPPGASPPCPLAADDPFVRAAEDFHRSCFEDRPADRHARVRALIELARERGLIVDSAPWSHLDLPGHRVFQSIASTLETFDVGSTLSLIALATGVSERQARRDLQSTLTRMRLPYAGWRDAARRFRVRIAIVLLSGPDTTIQEVARAVGYRHQEALANAFAEMGLPAPARLKRTLLAAD